MKRTDYHAGMKRRIRWRWWGRWGAVLVCLLLIAAFLRSGWWVHEVRWRSVDRTFAIGINQGSVTLMDSVHPGTPILGDRRFRHIDLSSIRPSPSWVFGRWFRWDRHRTSVGSDAYVFIPLWLPFALTLLAAGWHFWIDRRRAPGLCPRCGYDLAGVSGGVCPECGASPPSASA